MATSFIFILLVDCQIYIKLGLIFLLFITLIFIDLYLYKDYHYLILSYFSNIPIKHRFSCYSHFSVFLKLFMVISISIVYLILVLKVLRFWLIILNFIIINYSFIITFITINYKSFIILSLI
jgi:hypothetical protein